MKVRVGARVTRDRKVKRFEEGHLCGEGEGKSEGFKRKVLRSGGIDEITCNSKTQLLTVTFF